jgi:hypothetical protein
LPAHHRPAVLLLPPPFSSPAPPFFLLTRRHRSSSSPLSLFFLLTRHRRSSFSLAAAVLPHHSPPPFFLPKAPASAAYSDMIPELNSITSLFTEKQKHMAESIGFKLFAKPLHPLLFDKQFQVCRLFTPTKRPNGRL